MILWGGFVPAAVVCAGALARWSRRGGRVLAGMIPLLMGVGIAIAARYAFGAVELWAIESVRRIGTIAIVCGVLGGAQGMLGARRWAQATCPVLGAGFASWSVLEVLVASGRLDRVGLWLGVGAIALLCGAGAQGATLVRDRLGPIWIGGGLGLCAMMLAGALMLGAHVAIGAQIAGALCAVTLSAGIVAIVVRRPAASGGSVVVFAGVVSALLAWGRFFGGVYTSEGWTPGLPWMSVVLFGLAPLGMLIARLRLPWDRRRALRGIWALLGLLVLAGLALALSVGGDSSVGAEDDPYAEMIGGG